MKIVVKTSLSEIASDAWNLMVPDAYPFLQYQFLFGLEFNGCIRDKNGWRGHHLLAFNEANQLIAALPCYQKMHSYGEYIFDWAWADAYQRAGLNYYPKLSCAVPFTPATGPRLLTSPKLSSNERHQVIEKLIDALLESAKAENMSSIHILFNEKELIKPFEKKAFFSRSSSQFQWKNNNGNNALYNTFDDFLAQLNSRKRKNIKRERRRIKEAKVEFRWYSGDGLSEKIILDMFAFYQRTIQRYGAQQYLNKDFFIYLATEFRNSTAVLLAYNQESVIAGGLYFRSKHTLYGRYWGALDDFHSLHFETCYYQPIEYCIKQGLATFEAGAQGEHKLSRGLLPQTTHSLHWFADQRFEMAIQNYVDEEKAHIDKYQTLLNQHSPFKEI